MLAGLCVAILAASCLYFRSVLPTFCRCFMLLLLCLYLASTLSLPHASTLVSLPSTFSLYLLPYVSTSCFYFCVSTFYFYVSTFYLLLLLLCLYLLPFVATSCFYFYVCTFYPLSLPSTSCLCLMFLLFCLYLVSASEIVNKFLCFSNA